MCKNKAQTETWVGIALIFFIIIVSNYGDDEKKEDGNIKTEDPIVVAIENPTTTIAGVAVSIPLAVTAGKLITVPVIKKIESSEEVISLPTPVVIGDTDVAEIVETPTIVTEVNGVLGYNAVNDVIELADIMVSEEFDSLIPETTTTVDQVSKKVEDTGVVQNNVDSADDMSATSDVIISDSPSKVIDNSLDPTLVPEGVSNKTQVVELDHRGMKKSITFFLDETPVSKVNYSNRNYMFGGGIVKKSHVAYHVDGTKTVLKFWDAGSYLGKKQEELVYSSDNQMINKIVYSPYNQTIIFEKSYI